MYIPSTTVRLVLTEELRSLESKYKLENLDATIFAKFVDPVTQADVEESVVGNIHFGDEAISTTKHKDPEHAISYQDDAPTPYHYNGYLTMKLLFPIFEGYQLTVIMHRESHLE